MMKVSKKMENENIEDLKKENIKLKNKWKNFSWNILFNAFQKEKCFRYFVKDLEIHLKYKNIKRKNK